MNHEFTATEPQTVYVELQAGTVAVTAAATDTAVVEVTGPDADAVSVEQRGSRLDIVGPRRSGFFLSTSRDLAVTVRVPEHSNLVTKLGSASVTATGPLGEIRVATGSGDVAVEDVQRTASVKTGSGHITVRTVGGTADLKAGSGRIKVGHVAGEARLATGSGDIEVGRADGGTSLKSGSGDLTVTLATADTSLSAASGDLRVGRLDRGRAQLKNASGDIRVGIPHGTPVWTDITSTTGRVRSNLASAGAPAEGQDHVEVRARTVTGDIYLEQVTPTADAPTGDTQPQELT